MDHHVYIIAHVASGRRYVGKTSGSPQRRWRQHVNSAMRGKSFCKRLGRAIKKYGADAFTFEVVESYATSPEALAAEVTMIAKLRTRGPLGFNITAGGQGTTGRKMKTSTAAKLRAANLGRKASAETKAKLSAVHKGRKMPPRSEEWRRKISDARKRELANGTRVSPFIVGVSPTEEQRAKMRKPKTLTDEQRRANSERCSRQLRERWQDPEWLAKHAAITAERNRQKWEDPEYRARMTEILRANNDARRTKAGQF